MVTDVSQERDAIVAVLLDLLIPARRRVGGRIAPRIIVECEEVASLIVRAAIHVGRHIVSVALNVRRGVPDWNLTVALATDVLLHVTGHRFDVWRAVGVVICVDDL